MTDKQKHEAIDACERKIQDLLIDLENEIGHHIDDVDVDTRNFGQMRTSIFVPDLHGV